jgi:alcohol-forming fatty acyl-CoA reductase
VPEFDHLDGSHVLLTGATGFLGQATLEKLLASYPRTRVSVMIRPRGSATAQRRLDSLLRKPVFRPLRERIGVEELRQRVADRVTVIEGDLGHVTLPDDLDVVIHGASTVSFDPPIDEAFTTNVAGVVNLYEALEATGSDPYVVHVSTAYVAGVRKGVVPEQTLDHRVDWRTEMAAALAARADVERDSRRPEVLRRAMAKARSEHGKAGPQSVMKAAEEAREEWVTDRLVEYGRSRAQSLSWPDVYTFTKALGERAAEEMWAEKGHRLSIVRPAIVESALKHPYPGWIDGFKMADPIIIAYGRGILPEFPGLPDSVVDLIPVDMVVNATLAVAATPAKPSVPAYFHISSGGRNPLPFRRLYEHVREYFQEHPMPAGERGHIQVPVWRFPGSRQVELMLRSGERATSFAERALLRLPASTRTRDWMTAVHRQQNELEFLRKYSDLYQAYTAAEVIYEDHHTYELHQTIAPEFVEEYGFDSAIIDWRDYLKDIHSPSVTALMRAYQAKPSGNRRRGGVTDAPPLPEGTDIAAVFDLEGTIVASNLIETYLWARLSSLPPTQWTAEIADLMRSFPRYLRAERQDRGDFVRAFLRRYEGADVAELRRLVSDVLGDALLQRVMPEAVRQIRKHRAAGHKTILITGTIDVFVEPLAGLFDEIVASHMHTRDGAFTGYLESPPLVDEARAAWLRRHATDGGLDLSRSYAYGDSYSDRPLLELVGTPAAVNPDPTLFRHARRNNWRIYDWGSQTRGAGDVMIDTARRRVRP